MKNAVSQYTNKAIDNKLESIFKIRMGTFLSYAVADTTTRKINVQLYNIEKTEDAAPSLPQQINDIPLLYFGTNRAQTDYDLLVGDEILLLFADDTTDGWRKIGGNIPTLKDRNDTHSIDYAYAIPVSSFHNKLTISTLGHYQIKLLAGQKLQMGIAAGATYTIEIIQEMYTVFNAMNTIVTTDGDTFAAAFATFQSTILTPFLVKLQTLGTVV